jgi:two-component system, LytTR family, sensor kinase
MQFVLFKRRSYNQANNKHQLKYIRTMNKWFSYENIFFRNLLVASFFFGLIYAQVVFTGPTRDMPSPGMKTMLLLFFSVFSLIFLHNHFSVRLLLLRGKYFWFLLAAVSFLLLISLVTFSAFTYTNVPTSYPAEILSAVLSLVIGTGFYFLNKWILQNVFKTQKELFNKEAELNFLKQQLSPHFLFNALNNLYGTSLATPEIVSDKILELSSLLRYQVESTRIDQVKLKEELGFVNDYLSYINYKTNNLQLVQKNTGTMDAVYLPPLLFLPLLENAIKYSAETGNASISIAWFFDKRHLSFTIQNNYLPDQSNSIGTQIGLANLKRRLEILRIKYELKTETNVSGIYSTTLKLWDLTIVA